MSNQRPAICLPSQFLIKWVALFLASILFGIGLSAAFHRHVVILPKPLTTITVTIDAVQGHNHDGTWHRVPADLYLVDSSSQLEGGSYLGPLSNDPKHLTAISRIPGTKIWFRINWGADHQFLPISPWPNSAINYRVKFPASH